MNKIFKHIIIIIILFFLVYVYLFEPDCLFLKVFNVPCISCGLTRAFKSIFSLDLYGALFYNILSIPLFLFFVVLFSLYFFKLFFRKDYLNKFFNYFAINYKYLLLILIVGWIINIILYIN